MKSRKNITIFCIRANALAAMISLFVITQSQAQSQGPFGGGTLTNSPIAGSSASWNNPSYAQSSDGQSASSGNLSSMGDYTDFLSITGFGFSVPEDMEVTGIEISITKSSNDDIKTKDYRVQLIKNGIVTGSNKALPSSWNSQTSPVAYGGNGDLWGETWTPDDINNSNFGIAFAAERRGGGGGFLNPAVDFIEIKIFYGAPLPVELVSFTAAQASNKVMLQWSTASELNNDFFTIERTLNGASFETVAKVKGSGNSNTPKSYSVYDEDPPLGTVYYRLKQTDFDGKFEYSDLIPVAINVMTSPECKFIVKPNPCPGACEVSVSGCDHENVSVALVDAFGNVVYTQVPGTGKENTFMIDAANNLKPGVYVVMGETRGKSFSEKVILQNRIHPFFPGAVFILAAVMFFFRRKPKFFSGR